MSTFGGCERGCFTIGGPWITADPNCPIHGTEALRRERHESEETQATDERFRALEARVEALDEQHESDQETIRDLSAARKAGVLP